MSLTNPGASEVDDAGTINQQITIDYQWPIYFLTHKSIDFMIFKKSHAINSELKRPFWSCETLEDLLRDPTWTQLKVGDDGFKVNSVIDQA